jgi:hypothetical protein
MILPESFANNPAPNIHAQPQPQPQPETEMPSIAQLVLKGLFDKLLTMAEQKADIEQAAEFVYEKLPDDLLQYLELPNWFDILCSVDARIAQHAEWMAKVKARVDALLAEPDPEPESP